MESKLIKVKPITLFESNEWGGWKFNAEDLCPTLRANKVCAGIIEVRKMNDTNILGNIQPDNPHQSGNVYDTNGVAPNIMAGTHGYGMGYFIDNKKICAMRGRDPENPSDRTVGNPNLEQRLEVRKDDCSNTLTTVGKDNLVLELKELENYEELDEEFYNFLYEIDGDIYLIRIRKLIPLECFRLMDVPEDLALKMLETESASQCYKAAGNSIVVNCLVAILGQLFEGKEDVYKSKGNGLKRGEN